MSKTLASPSVTTRGRKGESYAAFTKRVAADQERVDAKCAALDKFTPRCTACGETCDPIDSGKCCRENGMQMVSRWAHEKAGLEWYRLGYFGGSWSMEVERLAALLDRTRAGEP